MNITDAELARLEELAELYLSGNALPFAESDYRESACNAVPSLVSEVRALRRYSQMMRSGNKVVRDDLESENASLRGQVEALQKMVEWLARECADGTNDCPYLTWYRDWIPPTRPEWCSCTDTKEGGFDCTKDAKECWLKAARDSIVEES